MGRHLHLTSSAYVASHRILPSSPQGTQQEPSAIKAVSSTSPIATTNSTVSRLTEAFGLTLDDMLTSTTNQRRQLTVPWALAGILCATAAGISSLAIADPALREALPAQPRQDHQRPWLP